MYYIRIQDTLVNLANVDFIDLDTNDLIIEFSKGGYKRFSKTQGIDRMGKPYEGVDVRAEFERIEKAVMAEVESTKAFYEATKINIVATKKQVEALKMQMKAMKDAEENETEMRAAVLDFINSKKEGENEPEAVYKASSWTSGDKE